MPPSPYTACTCCSNPMRSRKNKTTEQKQAMREEIPKLVFHAAHGLCEGCTSKERRAEIVLRQTTEAPARPDWLRDGLGSCASVDPDLWYPDLGVRPTIAQRICGECPFSAECLTWALDNNEQFGIWSGTTPGQRREMRKRARAAA